MCQVNGREIRDGNTGREWDGMPRIINFGVNFDGALHSDAMDYLAELASRKYLEQRGTKSYLVFRATWIQKKINQGTFYNSGAEGIYQGLLNYGEGDVDIESSLNNFGSMRMDMEELVQSTSR